SLMKPAGLIILSFLLNFNTPAWGFISIIAKITSLAGLIWFVILINMYRVRQKIKAPQINTVYCPITGKVSDIHSSADATRITIRKSFLDTVEIRCPHESCRWENASLVLDIDGSKITISLSGRKVIPFAEAEMKVGQVIGAIIGNGLCQITMPASLGNLLESGKIVDSGESWLYKSDLNPLSIMNL
ncbi:MAG TPA: hypothetical protein PKI59_07940, partial [Candidatus Cloacimonadota bacterium]|nr:hypothetical protein [Candidatus Cloacimonadota bacterium]